MPGPGDGRTFVVVEGEPTPECGKQDTVIQVVSERVRELTLQVLAGVGTERRI
jgi:hypothetical protein